MQALFERLHPLCHPGTRLLIYSYSRLWQPVLRMAEILGAKYRQPPESWLPPEEVRHMLTLADFELVRSDAHVLCPAGIPGAELLNRYMGRLPLVEHLSLMYGIVARPAAFRFPGHRKSRPTVSVVVPCRNEAGHIPELVRRLPDLGPNSEYLFVEGHSKDDTEGAIRRAIEAHPEKPLRFLKQPGRGKGDAVRHGFAHARGEVLAILDSDMGVAPEDLPKFVEALVRGKGEFVNGSRLVYPMEGQAMRFLNLLANKFFAALFTWVLGQQVRDTLCGTKVLSRESYRRSPPTARLLRRLRPVRRLRPAVRRGRASQPAGSSTSRCTTTPRTATHQHLALLARPAAAADESSFAARRLKFLS